MRLFRVVLMAFFFVAGAFASENPPLWGSLTPGAYGVGFTVRSQYDYSRDFRLRIGHDGQRYEGKTARPIQILVWYPATIKPGSTRLFFRDYVALGARELAFEPLTEQDRSAAINAYIGNRVSGSNYGSEALEQLLDCKTATVADAPAVNGKFPLIVYAPGAGGNAFENAILCEYLASHGYVVAALPSIGAYARSINVDLAGFYSYVRDVEFVLAVMQSFPSTDAANPGLIGFSMGGSANTLVQMRKLNICAAVYLDTGLPFPDFMDQRFKNLWEYDRDSLRAPQLYLVRKTAQADPEFAGKIRYADVYTLWSTQDYIRHLDYRADGMFSGLIPGFFPDKAEERKALYETECLYTLNFLNASLKKDPQAIEFMKKNPEQNNAPDKLLQFSFKPALPAPPRPWELAEILRNQGVGKYHKAVETVAKDDTAPPPIPEATLNNLGYEMFFAGNGPRAIEILRLAVELYPGSANALDSLSEALESAGNKEEALMLAKKALDQLAADKTLTDATRSNLQRILQERIKRLGG